jgi:hypothetical protein
MRKTIRTAVVVAAATVVATLLVPSATHAAPVTYTIDPLQSALTLLGNLTGNTATQQGSGSLTTSFSGSIVADKTGSTILFPGGSTITAANSGSWQPRDDGTTGSQPANYGRTAPGPFSTTAFEAIRSLQLDLFDDTSGLGATITGGNFASTSFGLEIDNGESDTQFGLGGSPDLSLVGKGTANSNGNGQSSVSTSGATETLTLKFSTGSIGYGVNTTGDSSLQFVGTIVATRLVPEPGSVTVLGGVAMTLRSRRRK